jgi:hypothetical protein
MIIRAIDPGPVESAYVDWDGKKILNFGKFDNYRLPDDDGVGYKPKAIFIEFIASYGMPVGAEVFETAFWVGRFWERYVSGGYECNKVYRKNIKLHICGSPQAKDSNIITAIVDRFDPLRKYGKYGKGTDKNKGPFFGFSKDVWQAFAVALYALDGRADE